MVMGDAYQKQHTLIYDQILPREKILTRWSIPPKDFGIVTPYIAQIELYSGLLRATDSPH